MLTRNARRVFCFIQFEYEQRVYFINFINFEVQPFSCLKNYDILLTLTWSSACGCGWNDCEWNWEWEGQTQGNTLMGLCLWWFELRDKWLSCLVTALTNKENYHLFFVLSYIIFTFFIVIRQRIYFIHWSGCKNDRFTTPARDQKLNQKWMQREIVKMRWLHRDYGAESRKRKFYCDCSVFYACRGLWSIVHRI